jgi:hypothetical protein
MSRNLSTRQLDKKRDFWRHSVFDDPGIVAEVTTKHAMENKATHRSNSCSFFLPQKFATSARLRFLLRRDSNKK